MTEPVAAAQRIDLRSLTPQRWKNGAGTTREIAVSPVGAGFSEFDWRLSVADVEGDGPFSVFEGVDRCIVLLRGAGMHLDSPHDQGSHILDRVLEPWAFTGERPIGARLIDGPCSDFNVMTRRGRWRNTVQVLRAANRAQAGDVTFLLCVAGRWHVGAETIEPLQGLLWRSPVDALMIAPVAGPDAPALLLVRLCHDHTT